MKEDIKEHLISLRALCIRIFNYMKANVDIENEKRLAEELINALKKKRELSDTQRNRLDAARIAIGKDDRRMLEAFLIDFKEIFKQFRV